MNKARRLFEKAFRLEFDISRQDDALLFYRRAAVLGSTKAQFYLAIYYAAGQNHCKNHRLARAWFKRAARGGEELCELAVDHGEQSVARQISSFESEKCKLDD